MMNEKNNIHFLNPCPLQRLYSTPNFKPVACINYTKKEEEKESLLNISNEETCHQLYWDISNDRIPTDKNVRRKFGFNFCISKTEELYLYHIYHDCFFRFKPQILILKKIYTFHEAYLQNNIYEYIQFLSSDSNPNEEYFNWFYNNRDLFKSINKID